MTIHTKKEAETLIAAMNEPSQDRHDMTIWEGNDGHLHASEEPSGSSTRCIHCVAYGGFGRGTWTLEALAEDLVRKLEYRSGKLTDGWVYDTHI